MVGRRSGGWAGRWWAGVRADGLFGTSVASSLESLSASSAISIMLMSLGVAEPTNEDRLLLLQGRVEWVGEFGW